MTLAQFRRMQLLTLKLAQAHKEYEVFILALNPEYSEGLELWAHLDDVGDAIDYLRAIQQRIGRILGVIPEGEAHVTDDSNVQ